MPYEDDKPPNEQDVPYQVSRITRISNGLQRSGSFAKKLDASTREDLREHSPNRIVREHVNNIIRLYFNKNPIVTQAHILHGLIKHMKLKCATKLLCFQDDKRRKEHVKIYQRHFLSLKN